jgi:hypothetical protein
MYESYPIAIQPPAERLESFGPLVDRGLSPETVVADFGISTRCRSLFKNDAMTIGRYFRTLRLQGCPRPSSRAMAGAVHSPSWRSAGASMICPT